ncbi:MAG: hypothetical protein V3T33_08530 [Myxococcota bacterium]
MSQAAVPQDRVQPQALPQPLATICAALAALGAVTFAVGLVMDPAKTWRAFHVNYIYFGGLAQAGVVVASIFVVVGARWPGPVRGLAQGLGAWVPITFVLAAVSFLGREYIYPWIEHPVEGKEAWLNPARLYLMDLAILGLLALLSMTFLKHSVRPGLHAAASRFEGRARRWCERWTRNWRGEEVERARSEARVRTLAPVICLVYALGFTVIGFDQVMSLSPTWFSNIFGAYFCWGAFLSAVAATALLAVLHRNHPGLEGEITPSRLHDLGKMVFAFSIFWMYLFFSQYIVIWYGNLPEETSFLAGRLGSQFFQDTWYFAISRLQEPYAPVSMVVWACCWIIPFWTLLGERPKRTWWWLGAISAIVVFGFWLERNVLIWPSFVPDDSLAWLGVIQIGIAAGFLGAFALVYLIYTRVFPSLAVPQRS